MSLPMSYRTEYRWTGNGVEGEENMPGYPPVAVGSPNGGKNLDPEHLFVAAAEVCLANTFFFFAEKTRLDVKSYRSTSDAALEPAPGGGFRFKEIVIKPVIEVSAESADRANQMIDRAHRYCLVSRSMSCPVRVEPDITPGS